MANASQHKLAVDHPSAGGASALVGAGGGVNVWEGQVMGVGNG
jgi:hypothetical protein